MIHEHRCEPKPRVSSFIDQLVRDDGSKSRAEVHK